MFFRTPAGPALKKLAAAALVPATLLLAAIIINPFREMLTEDDGWAYARSVEHLLHTGAYRLDAWSAANMPVQIYLAAAVSKVAGYSQGTLRCTTLALLCLALVSFYALLRELNSPRPQAIVLTLALLASPLVLMLAFTFMSDVQFLGWYLLALWLYVRALRRQRAAPMLLASAAAACAVGTRQFGLALLVGLFCASFFSVRSKRLRPQLLAAGLLLPALAAAAQLHIGLRSPNFTQAYRLAQQHHFLHQPLVALLREVFWRCSVLLQYLGISLLPALPLALVRSSTNSNRSRGNLRIAATLVLVSAAIVVALCISSPLSARPPATHHVLWEPLQLTWLLPSQLWRVRRFMRVLDALGILTGAILVWKALPLRTYLSRHMRPLKDAPPHLLFLGGTAAGLLLLHLAYVQFNDTYILPFIPLGLLLIAWTLRGRSLPRSALTLTAALSVLFVIVTALWMREEYASEQAAWQAAEALARAGVPAADISAPRHWIEYRGAFDQWIAAGAPGFDPLTTPPSAGYETLHDPFYAWLDQRDQHASFLVTYSLYGPPPPGWAIIATRAYPTFTFGKAFVWTLKREALHTPESAAPSPALTTH